MRTPNTSIPNYEAVRDRMQTGGMFAFAGQGGLSNLIQWWTGSKISHVGLCVRDADNRILVAESTMLSKTPDTITGKPTVGVSYVHASQRIDAYEGMVWYFPLRDWLREEELRRGMAWLKQTRGKEYDRLGAVRAGFAPIARFFRWAPWRWQLVSDMRLFCSELVYRFHQETRRLPGGNHAEEITPAACLKLRQGDGANLWAIPWLVKGAHPPLNHNEYELTARSTDGAWAAGGMP